MDSADTADIVHNVDTLGIDKNVISVDNVSSVNSVHNVHNANDEAATRASSEPQGGDKVGWQERTQMH